MLDVSGLRVEIAARRRATVVVDDVSLFVRPGETLGIVGESGSGKTMTAMSVMRLLPPGGRIAGGSISVAGADVVALPESRMREVRGRDVGMVFQDPMTCLNPTMSVGSQIAEPVRAHLGASRGAATERAAEVLGLVGMPRPRERLRAYPHELSGGLRQRVVIAMALACSPKLLIADEPTTALDVTIQDQILALLDELRGSLGMGLLLITHDMGVIAGRADRVSVMYAGRVVETGPIAEIFHSMHHPYTQALLESIPDLETDRRQTLYSIPGTPPDLAHLGPGCRFAPRCRYATQRCREEDPRLEGDADGHQFACFHPVDGPRVEIRSAEAASTTAGSGIEILRVENLVKEFPIKR
nr:ABC transporter ATP-binding protein [Actinomycetota bacterium]